MTIQTIQINTDTHVVVPRVPTIRMIEEGMAVPCCDAEHDDFNAVYAVMIAAAPQPEQAQPADLAETLIAGGVLWKDDKPEQAQQSDSIHLPPLPDLPQKIGSYSCDYWEDEQIYEYAQDYAREAVRANAQPAPPNVQALVEIC